MGGKRKATGRHLALWGRSRISQVSSVIGVFSHRVTFIPGSAVFYDGVGVYTAICSSCELRSVAKLSLSSSPPALLHKYSSSRSSNMEPSVALQLQPHLTFPSSEKRAVRFNEITRGLSHLRWSLRRRLVADSRPLALAKALAVSDGELNALDVVKCATSQCSSSNCSLPGVPGGGGSGVGQVASWAVSFERLLEDPLGVQYFTAFLKSEVSAENILFWQACEKFRKIPIGNTQQLSREALSIYNCYLSSNATTPINIDDKVRVEEKDIQNPHPEIFQKAQQQIFKLMKFDSYTRFVRSQLYQSCMLADVEGKTLPEPGQRSKTLLTAKLTNTNTSSQQPKAEQKTLFSKEKVKLKAVKTDPESLVERRKGKMGWEKRKDKRGSWGDSQVVVKPGFPSAEAEQLAWGSNDANVVMKTRAEKYCCVFLPDGTASLTPARPGLTVRGMLMGLCEKRGLPLSDIIIYLQGKDKQPLSLDQDSSVLKDQQVFLELRVTFAVEVAFTGKRKAIMVKANQTLQEALSSILAKQRLRPQDALVTVKGNDEPLSMDTVVSSLANKILILNKMKGVDQSISWKASPALQGRRGAVEFDANASSFYRSNPKHRNPALRRTYDTEGLVELLNRAQCCSADDQRGLLKKEHLMLPEFLQLPLDEDEEEDEDEDEGQEEEGLRSITSIKSSSTEKLGNSNAAERAQEEEYGTRRSNPARETVKEYCCSVLVYHLEQQTVRRRRRTEVCELICFAKKNLAMEHTESKLSSTSPQKQTVKNRSKSTDEVQQAKKAFHTPQKSLPAKPETEKLEEHAELSASSDELK